jgi:hypothetical protein
MEMQTRHPSWSALSIRCCCSDRANLGEPLNCELVGPAGVPADGGFPCGPRLRGDVVRVAAETGGVVRQRLRPEPNGDTDESLWTPISDVARLRRSSRVEIGLALAQTVPASGHVDPVPVGGLIQH